MTAAEPLSPSPEQDPVDDAARQDLRALFAFESPHRRGPASLVYRARDLEYDQPVALKVMLRAPEAGPAAEQAFHRAAATVAALEHPRIVPLYSAGATDRLFWWSMPYVEGRSVAEGLESDGRKDLASCLRLAQQVADALDFAHRLGVIHAGLKPANVLVDATGDAHVTDFWVPWTLAQLGAVAGGREDTGSALHLAPEQRLRREPSPAGDQYALAALVRDCLGGTGALVVVPPHVRAVIGRALGATPDARFANVLDFGAALRAPRPAVTSVAFLPDEFAEDEDVRGDEAPAQRRRWVPVGLLALVVAAAAAAVWVLGSWVMSAETSSARPWPVAPVRPESVVALQPIVVRHDSPAPVPRAPAAPRRAPAAAPPPGAPPAHVFINARPWGQVYLDDMLLGNTPRADVPIPPGSHRVRVVHDGFEPYEVTILVAPGQRVRLTDIELRELKP